MLSLVCSSRTCRPRLTLLFFPPFFWLQVSLAALRPGRAVVCAKKDAYNTPVASCQFIGPMPNRCLFACACVCVCLCLCLFLCVCVSVFVFLIICVAFPRNSHSQQHSPMGHSSDGPRRFRACWRHQGGCCRKQLLDWTLQRNV